MSIELSNSRKRAGLLFKAAIKANVSDELIESIVAARAYLEELDTQVNGNAAKNEIGEKNRPTIGERLFALNRGISTSTYGPTSTHKETMELVKTELMDLNEKLSTHKATLMALGDQVRTAGGAWIE